MHIASTLFADLSGERRGTCLRLFRAGYGRRICCVGLRIGDAAIVFDGLVFNFGNRLFSFFGRPRLHFHFHDNFRGYDSNPFRLGCSARVSSAIGASSGSSSTSSATSRISTGRLQLGCSRRLLQIANLFFLGVVQRLDAGAAVFSERLAGQHGEVARTRPERVPQVTGQGATELASAPSKIPPCAEGARLRKRIWNREIHGRDSVAGGSACRGHHGRLLRHDPRVVTGRFVERCARGSGLGSAGSDCAAQLPSVRSA